MGGKCAKVKTHLVKGNSKDKWKNEIVYREEVSLKYKEIKALFPRNPNIDMRKEVWIDEPASECSTPKWGSI